MIESLDLDTLTWADLVLAARSRLGDLGSDWTLHAPVDPGMTIIEALAAQLETQVFQLDQTDPNFVVRAARLLNIDPTKTATPTVLLSALRTPNTANTPESAGQVVPGLVLTSDTSSATLTTQSTVTFIADATLAQVDVDGIEVSGSLRARQPIVLFGSEHDLTLTIRAPRIPTGGELAIAFAIEPAPGEPDPRFGWSSTLDSIITHVEEPTGTRDVGHSDSRDETTRNKLDLTWHVNGERVTVNDATFGLRHSGLVLLPLRPGPPGTLTVSIGASRPRWVDPPVLTGVTLNAFVGHDRQAHSFTTGTDPKLVRVLSEANLKGLANPELRLAGLFSDLAATSPTKLLADPHNTLTLRERDGRSYQWTQIDAIATAGPGDRVFEVDRDQSALRFGDGTHGRVPRPARPFDAQLHLVTGGGAGRALSNATQWHTTGIEARQEQTIRGGTDPETTPEAQDRIRRTGRARTVTVRAEDYRSIVQRIPGLKTARVHVVAGYDPNAPSVHVTDAVSVIVIPTAYRPSLSDEALTGDYRVKTPRLDAGLREPLQAALQQSRLVGTNVFVVEPTYRPVAVTLETVAATALSPRPVIAALRRYLDSVVGGPDGHGWAVGQPVPVATLLGIAQKVIGSTTLSSIVVRVGSDETQRCAPQLSTCDSIPLRRTDLPYLDRVTLVTP
jgi:Baseplate J-like protein